MLNRTGNDLKPKDEHFAEGTMTDLEDTLCVTAPLLLTSYDRSHMDLRRTNSKAQAHCSAMFCTYAIFNLRMLSLRSEVPASELRLFYTIDMNYDLYSLLRSVCNSTRVHYTLSMVLASFTPTLKAERREGVCKLCLI